MRPFSHRLLLPSPSFPSVSRVCLLMEAFKSTIIMLRRQCCCWCRSPFMRQYNTTACQTQATQRSQVCGGTAAAQVSSVSVFLIYRATFFFFFFASVFMRTFLYAVRRSTPFLFINIFFFALAVSLLFRC